MNRILEGDSAEVDCEVTVMKANSKVFNSSEEFRNLKIPYGECDQIIPGLDEAVRRSAESHGTPVHGEYFDSPKDQNGRMISSDFRLRTYRRENFGSSDAMIKNFVLFSLGPMNDIMWDIGRFGSTEDRRQLLISICGLIYIARYEQSHFTADRLYNYIRSTYTTKHHNRLTGEVFNGLAHYPSRVRVSNVIIPRLIRLGVINTLDGNEFWIDPSVIYYDPTGMNTKAIPNGLPNKPCIRTGVVITKSAEIRQKQFVENSVFARFVANKDMLEDFACICAAHTTAALAFFAMMSCVRIGNDHFYIGPHFVETLLNITHRQSQTVSSNLAKMNLISYVKPEDIDHTKHARTYAKYTIGALNICIAAVGRLTDDIMTIVKKTFAVAEVIGSVLDLYGWMKRRIANHRKDEHLLALEAKAAKIAASLLAVPQMAPAMTC